MFVRQFIDNQLKDFNEKSFIKVLQILAIAALFIIFYGFIYSGFQVVDEFEHLHASWLISIGKLPYRDFFEHHHPLLWYLSAPIVGLFYDKAIIFYVMRAVSCIISFVTVWYVYKISLLITNKTGAWLAIVCALGNYITAYNFYQFRPDNYMNCCFIIGLYYWFLNLKTRQMKFLVYSFLWFSFSVLFLQKISMLLTFVECIMFGLIFFKKMTLKENIVAPFSAVGVFLLFGAWLFYKDIFWEYLALNLRFNQALVYYFDRGSFWINNLFLSFYGVALFTAVYFFKKENLIFKLVAIIYIIEFIMRGYYFAPHPNYYTLLTFLAAILLSVWGKFLMPKYKIWTIGIVIVLFVQMHFLLQRIEITSARFNSLEQYKMADYIHKNTPRDEYLMNGYDKNFNIYRNDASYYWFGLEMLLPIMENEFNIQTNTDINNLVISYRPKFIYATDYPDLQALRTYGERKLIQQYIPEIIDALYTKTPFENLLVRK